MKIKDWFLGEKKKLTPMSGKQRFEYIWEYYRYTILAVAAALVITVSLAGNYREQHKDVLISGIFLNTATSQEGYTHLREDYWQFCGGDADTRVELMEARYTSSGETVLMVDTMIAAQELDYIILDGDTLRSLDSRELAMDLRELLPEELLSQAEAAEAGGRIIAVDLTQTAFGQEYPMLTQPSYLMVVSNTPNPEKAVRFLEYLLES